MLPLDGEDVRTVKRGLKDRFSDISKNSPPREQDVFWERFSNRKAFFLLLSVLLTGVAVGAAWGVFVPLFQDRWVLPLQFSGIPVSGSGFFSCFSTLLLNVLIGLIPLFLLGVTAFGVFAVPLFLFFRGVTVGMGVSFFLWEDELSGLVRCALIYTPAAAAAGALLLLFAVRSLVFSEHLAKVSFSSQEGSLDLKLYFHDLLFFLSFAAGISLIGCLPATVYSVFL